MDEKEKYSKLAQLVKDAEDALSKAQEFADQHGLYFDFGPAYGMGGTYFGVSNEDRKEMEQTGTRLEDGWLASSNSC